MDDDEIAMALQGARERLCRVQCHLDAVDRDIIQGALNRIDLVGCDLPQWSKYDGAHRSSD